MAEFCMKRLKESMEIPIFFVFFAIAISDPVHVIYVTYQTCTVLMDFNSTDCEKLSSNSSDNITNEMRILVQPKASYILMTGGMIAQIFPVILCLFLGPWSDKNGRKSILMVNLGGYLCCYGIKLILVLMGPISPWYFLFDSVPIVFTGGFATYFMLVLCYLTDKTTAKNRGVRMAIMECAVALGLLLGTVSSSYVLAFTNFATVYAIAAGCFAVSFLYTVLWIPESVQVAPRGDPNNRLFTLVHVRDMVRTTVKRRENYTRCILLMVVAALAIYMIALNNGGVLYWFLSNKFHWPLEQYTLYSSAVSVSSILGTIIAIYFFHKLLKIKETVMLVFGFTTMSFGAILQGLATTDWQIYTAGGIKSFGGIVGPMLRSLVSKVVPAEEIGKIFALTVALECLVGVGCAPFYTLIYNSTIETAPETFSFVIGGIYIIELVITLCIMTVQKLRNADVPYDHVENESTA